MGNLRQRRVAIAIVLCTLGLTALFMAQGTTRLMAASLLELDTSAGPPSAAARRTPTAGGGRDRKDPTHILRRNIFDSETGDLLAVQKEPEEPTTDEPIEPIDPDAPPPDCDGSLRLVGTVVSGVLPEWSFAAVIGTTGKALLYRGGMSIDGRELVAIGFDRVYLAPSNGQVCQLRMFNPESEGSRRSPRVSLKRDKDDDEKKKRRARRRSDREGAISSADMEQNIERVSETEYNVDRSLVSKILENQSELMRTARIIPHEENGRVVGVKLYGIRRNSLLGKLGLNNGDMLRTINGFDMTSPDKALEAYARLRNADHLTVAVERRGKPLNLDFNIR